jgi:hypothetical protein
VDDCSSITRMYKKSWGTCELPTGVLQGIYK